MRRVGFPSEFLGIDPVIFCDPSLQIPEAWAPRGRWKGDTAMHTFCDDYRQEFFWRRPMEGLIVASQAGFCTAPDYSVYQDDPFEWAAYQNWRSAVVAAYWQDAGVTVLPVVRFVYGSNQYVLGGSAWAIRGPARYTPEFEWLDSVSEWADVAKPGLLVVFGNQVEVPASFDFPVVGRALFSSKGLAAQKEVA